MWLMVSVVLAVVIVAAGAKIRKECLDEFLSIVDDEIGKQLGSRLKKVYNLGSDGQKF